jgi:LysR family transcriptional regulator, nitrogen assimilation regulatory protein
LDLHQLEYFIVIRELGSFSKASLKLSMSQSVLTRQIQSLERELGISLYRRTGRGVELTQEGIIFENYAREILKTHQTALATIRETRITQAQPVIVGLPASIASVVAVGLVKDFKEKYPLHPLKILEGFSGHISEWLIDGRIDVAVLYNTKSTAFSSIKTDPLLEDRLVLVGSAQNAMQLPKGPISITSLASIPLILPSEEHGVRVLVDRALAEKGLKPNILVEIDSLYSSLVMVESGLGCTVVSYPCVKSWIDSKRIDYRPLIEPEITRKLVTAIAPNRPSTRPVRAFASLLRTHVAKHFKMQS